MPRPPCAAHTYCDYSRHCCHWCAAHTYYRCYDYSFQNIIVGYWRARHASPLQSLAGARLTTKGNGFIAQLYRSWAGEAAFSLLAGEACLAPTKPCGGKAINTIYCPHGGAALKFEVGHFLLELPNLCNVVAVEPYTAFDSTAVGGKYLLVPVIQTCAHVGLHPELYYVGVWVNAAYLHELQICGG